MRLSSLLSVARPPLRTIGPLSDLLVNTSWLLSAPEVESMLAAKGKLYAKMDIKIKPYHKAPRGQPRFGTVEPPKM